MQCTARARSHIPHTRIQTCSAQHVHGLTYHTRGYKHAVHSTCTVSHTTHEDTNMQCTARARSHIPHTRIQTCSAQHVHGLTYHTRGYKHAVHSTCTVSHTTHEDTNMQCTARARSHTPHTRIQTCSAQHVHGLTYHTRGYKHAVHSTCTVSHTTHEDTNMQCTARARSHIPHTRIQTCSAQHVHGLTYHTRGYKHAVHSTCTVSHTTHEDTNMQCTARARSHTPHMRIQTCSAQLVHGLTYHTRGYKHAVHSTCTVSHTTHEDTNMQCTARARSHTPHTRIQTCSAQHVHGLTHHT